MLAQLLGKGSLLRKSFPAGFGSAKNLAFRLLEAWHNAPLTIESMGCLTNGCVGSGIWGNHSALERIAMIKIGNISKKHLSGRLMLLMMILASTFQVYSDSGPCIDATKCFCDLIPTTCEV
jgi:hypothetical protein